jgi:hypothetical protein
MRTCFRSLTQCVTRCVCVCVIALQVRRQCQLHMRTCFRSLTQCVTMCVCVIALQMRRNCQLHMRTCFRSLTQCVTMCVCHCASNAKKVPMPTAHANMFSIVDAMCDNVCVCVIALQMRRKCQLHMRTCFRSLTQCVTMSVCCASDAKKVPTAHANMFSIVGAWETHVS